MQNPTDRRSLVKAAGNHRTPPPANRFIQTILTPREGHRRPVNALRGDQHDPSPLTDPRGAGTVRPGPVLAPLDGSRPFGRLAALVMVWLRERRRRASERD
ncbi:hypothetical protein [Labedella endophytica]|uniref:Uncharacterized protein n=1 Tax=Labedella endophytica TaxID=1523160 RepID=A0A433JNZ4_9MICO|nr:hypothetical protein [Labedella endophytica]RUQ98149.1 hypothetical protein ELQ94_14090 [Labedella endophytica]